MNERDINGCTLLHCLVGRKDPDGKETHELVLAKGADVNAKDIYYRATPLERARKNNNWNAITSGTITRKIHNLHFRLSPAPPEMVSPDDFRKEPSPSRQRAASRVIFPQHPYPLPGTSSSNACFIPQLMS